MHVGILHENKRRWGALLLAALLYGAGLTCASAVAAEPAAKGFVALILPGKSKSKPLKTAVDTIKAGVLAADKVHGGTDKLPLRVFDAGDSEEETLSLYNLAKSQGAQAVIGPLTRGAMNYLADAGELSVPVLALNSFDDATLRQRNLYSFGLSIEAEVQQVVRLMRSQQVQSPMVIQSEGPLSIRMRRAFVDEWRRVAGSEPAVFEVKDARTQLAGLQASMAGVDAVFFAADGQRASLVRPYLPSDRLYFATSQIAAGRNLPVDLSGVRYLEMPWITNTDDPEYAAYGRVRVGSNDMERLFALGVDAWTLAQMLGVDRQIGLVNGLTGRLEPGADGLILRELVSRTVTVRGQLPPEVLNASQPAALVP